MLKEGKRIFMDERLLALIIVGSMMYIALQIIYPLCVAGQNDFQSSKGLRLLPWDLHKNTKMNWLGCIVSSIFLFISLPGVWIGRFIYWAFHVHKNK